MSDAISAYLGTLHNSRCRTLGGRPTDIDARFGLVRDWELAGRVHLRAWLVRLRHRQHKDAYVNNQYRCLQLANGVRPGVRRRRGQRGEGGAGPVGAGEALPAGGDGVRCVRMDLS